MQETIVKIEKSKAKGKKYAAIVRNKQTRKTRRINFGASSYGQFRDSTPLRLYSAKNHGDKKRRANYFSRHSGVATKAAAVRKEKRSGRYTAKLLSHIYLW